MANELGWKVLNEEEISQDSLYKSKYQARQNSLEKFAQQFRIELNGISHEAVGVTWSQKDRDALMDSLHVDALTIVGVDFEVGKTGGFGIGGIGKQSLHPQATVRFKVFERGQEKPIFEVRGISGAATQEALDKTVGINSIENETKLFVEATNLALNETFAEYKKKIGK